MMPWVEISKARVRHQLLALCLVFMDFTVQAATKIKACNWLYSPASSGRMSALFFGEKS
jgi:hypothetical protein